MGPYIAAGLASFGLLALLGGLAYLEGGRGARFWPFLAAALPLGLLATPLSEGASWKMFSATIGIPNWRRGPLWGVLFLHFFPAVLKEAVKGLLLAVPAWRGWRESGRRALFAGFALGMGFGIGEMWYQAWRLGQGALLSSGEPFWRLLGGFGAQALLSTFFHAVASALLSWGAYLGYWWWGYLGAAGLHALARLGTLLVQWGRWPVAAEGRWLMFSAGVALALLLWLLARSASAEEGASDRIRE